MSILARMFPVGNLVGRCVTRFAQPAAMDCGAGEHFGHENAEMLKAGSGPNGLVWRVRGEDGDWVVKDYRGKKFVYRVIGRILVGREWRALRRLDGMEGIPIKAEKCGLLAIRYQFTEGETLSELRRRGVRLEREFFVELERLVRRLHVRGYAHLDLRNGKNILRRPDGKPHLLDFQAGLWVGKLPKPVQRVFHRIDYSGVYKWWKRMGEEGLTARRRGVLERVDVQRRFWPF